MKKFGMGIAGGIMVVATVLCAAGSEAAEEDGLIQSLLQADEKSWTEVIKFNGKVHVRYEVNENKSITSGSQQQDRARIQALLGMTAKVNDDIKAGIQIATGSTDPVSTNQTMSPGWQHKTVMLDLAYIEYAPKAVEGLAVTGGKMTNPYKTPGKSQLVWDCDLRPEGLTVAYVNKHLKPLELFGTMGLFSITENSTQGDVIMVGAQGGGTYTMDVGEDMKVKLTSAVAYYDYGGVKNKAVTNIGAAFGNTSSGGNYVDDFNIVDAYVEGAIDIYNLPVSLFFEYAVNTGAIRHAAKANKKEDTAYLLGLSVGKIKDPMDWQAFLNYRSIEKDAVVGQFNESDFGGGGTNCSGVNLGFAFSPLKYTEIGVSLFVTKTNESTTKDDYLRFQLDGSVKF